MELIDKRIKRRAYQAFRCFPLNSRFYLDVQFEGLSSDAVFLRRAEYCVERTSWFGSCNELEQAFRWLIKVGVLRREVDGQGLTSRVRLTPLGRQMLEMYPKMPFGKAGRLETVKHWVCRNWPFR